MNSLLLLLSPHKKPKINWNFLSAIMPSGLIFSRASNATMFDSAGKLVWAPANMHPNSTFAGASVSPSTFPTGYAVVTSSGLTGSVVGLGTEDGRPYVDIRVQGTTTGTTYQFGLNTVTSIVAAAGDSLTGSLYMRRSGGTTDNISYVQTYLREVGGSYPLTASENIDLDSATLKRYSVTRTWANTYNAQQMFRIVTPGSGSAVDITLRISGPQVERTSYNSPLPFQSTSGSAYYGPRFDYDPATLAAKGLLLEESRTNVLLNSSVLSSQSVEVTAQPYTLSFYGAGTVTLSGAATGSAEGTGVFPLRKALTFTPSAGTLTLTVTGTVQYAQLEAGAFASSYIQTNGAISTRAAENLNATSISSWFNSSQGAFFTTFVPEGYGSVNAFSVGLSDGTTSNMISSYTQPNGQSYGNIVIAGASYAGVTGQSLVVGSLAKHALIYKAGANLFYQNGIKSGAGTFATAYLPSGISRLDLMNRSDGTRSYNGWLQNFKYWNHIPSTAELQ